MEIENEIRECHFDEIYMAGVFSYKCHYYMRIMSTQLCNKCDYNAVDLEDGTLHKFNERDTVEELRGVFHVK